jgi:hypothetical protein
MQTITNMTLNTQNVADIAEVDANETRQIVQLPVPFFDMVGGGSAIVNTN